MQLIRILYSVLYYFQLNTKEIISLLWWPCSSRSYSLTSWCPRSRILSHKSHHRLPVQRKLKEVYQVWIILRTAYRLWNLASKSPEAGPRFLEPKWHKVMNYNVKQMNYRSFLLFSECFNKLLFEAEVITKNLCNHQLIS